MQIYNLASTISPRYIVKFEPAYIVWILS